MPGHRIHLELVFTTIGIWKIFQSRIERRMQGRILRQNGVVGGSQRMTECAVCQKQELREQIAEEPGGGNVHVDSLPPKLLDRDQLQFFDQPAGIPDRLDPEKLKYEREHRAFIAR